MSAANWPGAFLEAQAAERGAADNTTAAYARDLTVFLAFMTGHLGARPDFAALAGLGAAIRVIGGTGAQSDCYGANDGNSATD